MYAMKSPKAKPMEQVSMILAMTMAGFLTVAIPVVLEKMLDAGTQSAQVHPEQKLGK
jgi:Mg/Co/Ni transporter MgtE